MLEEELGFSEEGAIHLMRKKKGISKNWMAEAEELLGSLMERKVMTRGRRDFHTFSLSFKTWKPWIINFRQSHSPSHELVVI